MCEGRSVSNLAICSCVCIATWKDNLYHIGKHVYTYAAAYLEPSQTSTKELFCENS